MVTEDFEDAGGAETVTGGAPLPDDRPLGRPTFPNAESRGAPAGGLLLANGGMAPLPVGRETQVNAYEKLAPQGLSIPQRHFAIKHCKMCGRRSTGGNNKKCILSNFKLSSFSFTGLWYTAC